MQNLTENGWGATPFNWTFGGMYGGDANKGSDGNEPIGFERNGNVYYPSHQRITSTKNMFGFTKA
jgi:hypothetical protein